MVQTVKVLGEAPNIQFSGVEDKSGTNPILGGANGLISGTFRRGRLDKPMRITNANIRAELGHDKDSPSYQAVQNALDTFDFVWVQRIAIAIATGGV